MAGPPAPPAALHTVAQVQPLPQAQRSPHLQPARRVPLAVEVWFVFLDM